MVALGLSKITKKSPYLVMRAKKQKQSLVFLKCKHCAPGGSDPQFPQTRRELPEAQAAMPVDIGNCHPQLHESSKHLALFFV